MSRTIAALVFCILLQCTLAPLASAQGTFGMLPDPITARELDGYADRLGISPEQRRAINRFFEQYQEQFRALRDGEIAEFLEVMQQLQRSGMSMPDRRDMERFRRAWQSAFDRIRAVDEQFLNMVTAVLTEEQLAMVQRVRMARERQRHKGNEIGMMLPIHDLSETLLRMNLTPEERDRIDPALGEYERRLTAGMRTQSQVTFDFIFGMYDALEEVGFTDEALADPEEMTRLMQEMQRIMGEMFERLSEHAKDLRMLNVRTYRSLVDLLDEQRRRPFRDAFARSAFSELYFIANSEASRRFQAARSIDGLDDALREALAEAQRAFETDRDGVFDRALQFASENVRSPMADMFDDGDSEYDEQLRDLHAQAASVEARAAQALKELLPALYEESVNERSSESARAEQAEQLAHHGTSDWESTDIVEAGYAPSSDQFVPGPISNHDIATYADLLGLDEDSRVLMEDLHAMYVQRFEQDTAEVMAQLAQAKQRQWQFDPETGRGLPADPQRITDVYNLRRKAMSMITAVDESFFEDLALVLVDVPLERARLARIRNRYASTSRVASGIQRGAGYADLADIVRLLRWDAQLRQAIEQPLREWEQAVASAMAGYFDAAMATDEAQEVFFAEFQAQMEGQDMAQWHHFAERRREAVGPYQQRARATRLAVLQETEMARDAIVANLSHEDAAGFLDAYKRRAFPGVYNDRRAVHTSLRRALNLPDLSAASRDALMELNMTYNSRYHELTERMIELKRSSPGDMYAMNDQAEMADYLADEAAHSRLIFERDELNEWAIREMRSLLNDEQRERIAESR